MKTLLHLQIGDLCRAIFPEPRRPRIVQVVEILRESGGCSFEYEYTVKDLKMGKLWKGDADVLEPLPLTKAVFQRSGWQISDEWTGIVGHDDSLPDGVSRHCRWNFSTKVLSITGSKGDYLFVSEVKEVHTLQQDLRRAGLYGVARKIQFG